MGFSLFTPTYESITLDVFTQNETATTYYYYYYYYYYWSIASENALCPLFMVSEITTYYCSIKYYTSDALVAVLLVVVMLAYLLTT